MKPAPVGSLRARLREARAGIQRERVRLDAILREVEYLQTLEDQGLEDNADVVERLLDRAKGAYR